MFHVSSLLHDDDDYNGDHDDDDGRDGDHGDDGDDVEYEESDD